MRRSVAICFCCMVLAGCTFSVVVVVDDRDRVCVNAGDVDVSVPIEVLP